MPALDPLRGSPPPAREAEDAESPVRPYALVGGRTRVPAELGLSVESLVHGLVGPSPDLTPEERRILDLTSGHYQSVAELSARMRLPLGVVRVVVADLADRGSVRVHGRHPLDTVAHRRVLESVLDGIATL